FGRCWSRANPASMTLHDAQWDGGCGVFIELLTLSSEQKEFSTFLRLFCCIETKAFVLENPSFLL
ncbi:hypothetical protein, partial [Geobacillus zalihae]|uniref:hypothetical protein n=1 Tax=Geobacillus zalihae TaxID=213419 RepID=UPI001A9835F8